MLNKASLIEHNNYHFMIFCTPDDKNISYWIDQFKQYKVTDIVRTCEKTYTEEEIAAQGIRIHELKFDDGRFPSKEIIKAFLNIVSTVNQENMKDGEKRCIAVHCIAGLGR